MGIMAIIDHTMGCDNLPHVQAHYSGLLSAHFPSNKRKGVILPVMRVKDDPPFYLSVSVERG